MNERIEILDRSMDFVLLFLTVMSSAVFQFVTALPYDGANQSQVEIHEFLMRFSLRLFFLPFLLIVPSWLVIHVLRNEDQRMVLRAFVWSFTTAAMALDALALIVLAIPLTWEYFLYLIIIMLTAGVSVLFLAEAFVNYILDEYGKILLTDQNVSIHFFRKRWRFVRFLAPIASSLLFLGIVMVSLVA